MKCENCGNSHDGSYGSGRFCSAKCARGFSTKVKRKEINEKIKRSYLEKKKDLLQLVCKNDACKKIFSVAFNKRFQKFCSKSCVPKKWKNHDKVDWSTVHKKSYARGNNYVAGGTVKWIKYKNIKVQGTYEYRACEILDEMIEKGEIQAWEYSKIKIPYQGEDKKRHTYLVDFLIHTKEKQKLLEVKGRETSNDHLKWEAARNLGWEIEIWRKKDLFKMVP